MTKSGSLSTEWPLYACTEGRKGIESKHIKIPVGNKEMLSTIRNALCTVQVNKTGRPKIDKLSLANHNVPLLAPTIKESSGKQSNKF